MSTSEGNVKNPSEKVSPCPTCQKPVAPSDASFFPFCSNRCRMIDLGGWLDGRFRVAGSDAPSLPDAGEGEDRSG
ncbi:MAG: DNA gyrase inhibitor YacG [Nitrospinae bacterium CG11_big_fil_rev_8_21_14_0_20_56_8]|nr:MAG: DNA gyrase inhibitor YacG [Nitrospinae bacterium CG11_big_fil_rev_8_21_14_0_20_56_8]